MNDNWPGELPGSNPAAPYINRLRSAAMAGQLVDVKFPGGQAKLINNPNGKTLVLSANPSAQLDNYFPFKIYSMANVVDPTLSALTYQIRAGLVGWRSAYNLSVIGGNPLNPVGNGEQLIVCDCTDGAVNFESQPVAGTGGNIALANATDTLIYDPTGVAAATPQIVINATIDAIGQRNFSFWLVMIDDPDPAKGVYAQLWGRMWTRNVADPTGRQTQVFPASAANIIPIGYYDSADGFIVQVQFNNIVNRYAQSPLASVAASAGILRGYWTVNSLSGQVFWSGDRVVDDSTILYTIGGNNFYGVYTYISTPAAQSTAPVSGPLWVLDSMIIL